MSDGKPVNVQIASAGLRDAEQDFMMIISGSRSQQGALGKTEINKREFLLFRVAGSEG